MGKSRLLLEIRFALERAGVGLLHGRCESSETAATYLPFVETLREWVGVSPGEGGVPGVAEVVGRLRALGPELEEFLPLYLHLLAMPSAEHPVPRHLHREHFRLAMQEALAAFVTLVARQRPTALLLEDWHWADEASHEVLEQVAELVSGVPLLVVVTSRPGAARSWGSAGSPPHDFARPARRGIVGLHAPVHPAGGRGAGPAGGAGPRAQRREPVLPRGDHPSAPRGRRAGGRGRSGGSRRLAGDAPASRDRAGGDPDPARPPGPGGARSAAARLRGRPRVHPRHPRACDQPRPPAAGAADAEDAPASSSRSGSCPSRPIGSSTGSPSRPRWGACSTTSGKSCHGRVGEAIEARHERGLDEHLGRLVEHFSRAERWPRAVRYARLAAERANDLSQFAESLELLERTQSWLVRLPDDPERREALIDILFRQERLCETLGLRGRQQRIIDELVALLDPSREPARLAEACLRQGDLNTLLRRFEEAEAALERSLRLRDELGDAIGRRNTLRSLGLLRWHQGRDDEALDCIEATLAIDRERGDLEAHVGDLANLGGVLKGMGQTDRARATLEEALRLSAEAETGPDGAPGPTWPTSRPTSSTTSPTCTASWVTRPRRWSTSRRHGR